MMSTGNKTLAQLAAEHKEKKYVTIETASKLSGYTDVYIERLCRLGKIEYRLWSGDVIVPELESLLKETHTILVSYEGIQIVNKDETKEVAPAAVLVTEEPQLVTNSRAEDEKKPLTFVVRPVYSRVGPDASDIVHADENVEGEDNAPRDLPPLFSQEKKHIQVSEVSSTEETEHEELPSEIRTGPTRVTVFDGDHDVVLPQKPKKLSDTTQKESRSLVSLPMVLPEHHLLRVPEHPLVKSFVPNVILATIIVAGAALIGFLGDESTQKNMASENSFSEKELFANVAASFSDDVYVSKGVDGVIEVTPVFQNMDGNKQEFLLSPVGN